MKYKAATQPKTQEEVLILDGRVIGSIWVMDHGFQCQLKDVTTSGCYITMNGIGKTKEECLREAVKSAKEEAKTLIESAEIIEKELAE